MHVFISGVYGAADGGGGSYACDGSGPSSPTQPTGLISRPSHLRGYCKV